MGLGQAFQANFFKKTKRHAGIKQCHAIEEFRESMTIRGESSSTYMISIPWRFLASNWFGAAPIALHSGTRCQPSIIDYCHFIQ